MGALPFRGDDFPRLFEMRFVRGLRSLNLPQVDRAADMGRAEKVFDQKRTARERRSNEYRF